MSGDTLARRSDRAGGLRPEPVAPSQPVGAHPSRGRMFVCGDIHGCYDALMAALAKVGFDFDADKLFALGDLVDRGPDSERVFDLLREPWFESIQGNHEVLMIGAQDGQDAMIQCHLGNGGLWFAMLPAERRRELADRARKLPVAMTVTTPTGRRVGLVHADLPLNDWEDFSQSLNDPALADMAQWNRERIGKAKTEIGRQSMPRIRGVDHVYMGHTPVKEPVRAANMSWIDTGCFATGKLTVEELL